MNLNLRIDSKRVWLALQQRVESCEAAVCRLAWSIVGEELVAQLEQQLPPTLVRPVRFKSNADPPWTVWTTSELADVGSLEAWYSEFDFALEKGIDLGDVVVESSGIMDLIPILFGGGRLISTRVFRKELKTQTNWRIRLNHILLSTTEASAVSSEPDDEWRGHAGYWLRDARGIGGVPMPVLVHQLSGKTMVCECMEAFVPPGRQVERVLPGFGKGLIDVGLAEGICHLCVAREYGSDAALDLFPAQDLMLDTGYSFVLALQMNTNHKAASLEVKRLLGLSRWKREGELFLVVRQVFDGFRVVREYSPSWLGRQRIDIFVPDLGLAIEHQGQQHSEPVEFFGGQAGYERAVERDLQKRRLCEENGVQLVEVSFREPLTKAHLRRRFARFLST